MQAINQLLAAGLSKNVPSSRHLEPVQLANTDLTICFPPLNSVETTKCKELPYHKPTNMEIDHKHLKLAHRNLIMEP